MDDPDFHGMLRWLPEGSICLRLYGTHHVDVHKLARVDEGVLRLLEAEYDRRDTPGRDPSQKKARRRPPSRRCRGAEGRPERVPPYPHKCLKAMRRGYGFKSSSS